MSDIDRQLVKEIARKVIEELNKQSVSAQSIGTSTGVYDDIEKAIFAAKEAQKIWHNTLKETREKVICALRETMHEHAEAFAHRAHEETGMGRVECKIIKHHNAADATPGMEDLETRSWSGDKGLVVEDYAPYGVIAGITPSTHPIPVLFNSTVIMIASGNSVVFNVHPAAKKVSAFALEIFNKTIQNNGGPADLITMVREPTLQSLNTLMTHPNIPIIAATGGPAVVKAAFDAGKKVIAAGPGNPPVFIDDTADLNLAANHIIEGAAFDNNILCIAEKEIFVVASVFDAFMNAMSRVGAVRLNRRQIEMLTEKAFEKGKDGHFYPSRHYIGKNANVLGRAAGLDLSDDVRVLFGETEFGHLFVQEEQMMPFLPVVKVSDRKEGIRLAVKAEHKFGHTAVIYSNHLETITRFTKAIDTDIVVVNGPSLAGNGPRAGEGYFSHTISSPTGEGICTPRNFARVRRLSIYKSLQIV
ncbi:aldehyde dehydrogenase family protein [candidate division KSB1 bacterium]|nr:aldehyde dehydrogenase family protein [candidate division KSB1 bacterium]